MELKNRSLTRRCRTREAESLTAFRLPRMVANTTNGVDIEDRRSESESGYIASDEMCCRFPFAVPYISDCYVSSFLKANYRFNDMNRHELQI